MIRGDYDPDRIRRLKAPLRRAWARARYAMAAEEPGGPPPPVDPSTRGKVHRIGLVGVIIGLSALLIATLTIPGAALIGRLARNVAGRLEGGPTGIEGVSFKIAQRSVIYASGGQVIATLAGEENRMIVPIDQVPAVAQEAVIAIEDSRFYEHNGVDMGGMFRALFTNLEAGGIRQGGSTITQQLVKNVIVGTDKTLDRKIREAQYAIALEREKSKREILELYLNEAYFGEGIYGIGTAAEFYFGKKISKVTLAEAALLAGVIRAPERYGPLADAKSALSRRNLVLDRMAILGYATRVEADAAKAQPIKASAHALPKPVEPYFVEFIKDQILDNPKFGETRAERAAALFQGGLKIHTTLDLKLQRAASKAVSDVLTSPKDPAAALVSIEPSTGKVKAMVGGSDFEKNKYNLAVQGKRQAGSSFKPFTMIAALEAGVPPGFTLDTPSPIELTDAAGQVWKVNNYSHRGEGTMDLRRATELSVNSFYAQLIHKIGPEKVVATAQKLGIRSELRPYLSLALGTFEVSPYEMSSAYSTLANNGVHCVPFAIDRIVDAGGKTVLRNDPQCERVLDEKVAAQADAILAGVVTRGTGRTNGQIGRPAAAKTGPTDDYKDAWYTGFTPNFSTAVWMGYPKDRTRPLYNIHGYREVFGGSLPAMIWSKFMRVAHQGVPVTSFPAPPAAPKAVVPDVTSLPFEDAKTALEAAGFSVRQETVASSYAPGVVAGQDPASGTRVEAGRLITVFVSDGSGGGEPEPEPTVEPDPQPT
ncbi:MAG: penicillin-binding protein [Actinomycetota bacterium]